MALRRVQISIAMLLLACTAALAACADDIPEAPQQPTLRAAPAESAAQQQARPADDQSEPQTQLETIQALYADWAAQLTSFEMSLAVAVEPGQFSFGESVFLQAQLDPLQMYIEIDLSDLLGAMTDFVEDADPAATDEPEVDELLPTTIRMLLLEDGAYLSFSEDGWAAVPTSELFGSDLSALTSGLSDDAAGAMTDLADLTLLCAEQAGGLVFEDELDGAPVWVVSCDIDIDAMAALLEAADMPDRALPGLPGLPAGEPLDAVESLAYSVKIDQRNGALLAFNASVAFAGDLLGDEQDAGRTIVSSFGRVIAWNQPIDFPAPEPLIENGGIFE